MTARDLAILNLQEVRRRSLIVWRGIPDASLGWKPDEQAMSFGAMIRHVWEGAESYRRIVQHGGSLQLPEAYTDEPVSSVESEISLAAPLFERLVEDIRAFSDDDLERRVIDRSDVGYRRKLGDFLARIGYHESVHTGQMLQYMRMAHIPRPVIWD